VAARTIKLVLEYDGTDLCGWQRQDNGPTVQQHVEEAVSEMLGEPTTVTGASRTDAGVHAMGQVAHFHTDSTIPLDGFRLGLNSHLPDSIAVVAAAEMPHDFHARFSATGKRYRYQILTRRAPSPLLRRITWHRPRPLDLASMRAAAAPLIGEHDFSAFRAAGCTARHARRRITAIDLTTAGDVVTIEVAGNAFLRNMVRILAGTLVEVGESRRPPTSTATALASGLRTDAGQTAPAQGLTLLEVLYTARHEHPPG